MTIPEASQLIMQAAVIGAGGETFVLDMGEPVKIRYLAEQMIRLSGRRPEVDVPIAYIGLRPGEKLYEELFYATEELVATAHPKIRAARCARQGTQRGLSADLDALEEAVLGGNAAELRDLLQRLVPEWGQAQSTGDDLYA
jgi:FlaA1/EpsC-like NDP-sugar epimerase